MLSLGGGSIVPRGEAVGMRVPGPGLTGLRPGPPGELVLIPWLSGGGSRFQLFTTWQMIKNPESSFWWLRNFEAVVSGAGI